MQSERCLLFPIEGDLSVFKSKEVVQIVVYRLPSTPRGRSTMHNRVDLGVSGGKRVYGLNSSTSSSSRTSRKRRPRRLCRGERHTRRGRRRGLGQPNPHRRWTSASTAWTSPLPKASSDGLDRFDVSSAPIEDSLRPRIDLDEIAEHRRRWTRCLGCPARAELAHRPDAFGDSPGPAPGRRRKWHPWNTVIKPAPFRRMVCVSHDKEPFCDCYLHCHQEHDF